MNINTNLIKIERIIIFICPERETAVLKSKSLRHVPCQRLTIVPLPPTARVLGEFSSIWVYGWVPWINIVTLGNQIGFGGTNNFIR